MSLRSLLRIRCTIVHRSKSGADEYGNPQIVETGRTKTRCYKERVGAPTEGNLDRSTTSDDSTFVFAPDVKIGALDQVIVDGEPGVYEVIGQPEIAHNPRKGGKAHHLEVRMRRTR